MPRCATGAARLKAAERRVRALQLRRAGASYRDIGRALGCSESTACQDVHRAIERLDQLSAVEAHHYRALELSRLDDLQRAHWQAALGGDPAATAVILRVMDARAKLLGLNAPDRQDVTFTWAELARMAVEGRKQ